MRDGQTGDNGGKFAPLHHGKPGPARDLGTQPEQAAAGIDGDDFTNNGPDNQHHHHRDKGYALAEIHGRAEPEEKKRQGQIPDRKDQMFQFRRPPGLRQHDPGQECSQDLRKTQENGKPRIRQSHAHGQQGHEILLNVLGHKLIEPFEPVMSHDNGAGHQQDNFKQKQTHKCGGKRFPIAYAGNKRHQNRGHQIFENQQGQDKFRLGIGQALFFLQHLGGDGRTGGIGHGPDDKRRNQPQAEKQSNGHGSAEIEHHI